MKTKQANMIAKFTTETNGANQPNKALFSAIKVICKKTEEVVVDCRTYMSASRNASKVEACIWVSIANAKKPKSFEFGHVSGHGSASGWGYDKVSSAIGAAIDDAGIELYGTPYNVYSNEKVDMKRRARIGGVGGNAAEMACLAIAYAAGYRDCIVVQIG